MERKYWNWAWFMVFAVMFMGVSGVFPGAVSASKDTESAEVIIVGKNFVNLELSDEGVVIESKKGTFKPTEFLGVEGTALMLFLYNRITRDMGVDIVLRTYKDRIDRQYAEKTVDRVLKFYSENELIFKSRFDEKPATKIGILRFRV